MYEDIGSLIKRRRKEIGLTLEELAQKVGSTSSTVSKWERGKIARLKREKIMELAYALELAPARLFGYSQLEIDLAHKKQDIEVFRIPVYSLNATNVLSDDNIVRFIGTDRSDARICVVSNESYSHDKVIKKGSLLLLNRKLEYKNNSIVVAVSENKPYIARYYTNGLLSVLIRDTELIKLDNSITLLGEVVEIREEV